MGLRSPIPGREMQAGTREASCAPGASPQDLGVNAERHPAPKPLLNRPLQGGRPRPICEAMRHWITSFQFVDDSLNVMATGQISKFCFLQGSGRPVGKPPARHVAPVYLPRTTSL